MDWKGLKTKCRTTKFYFMSSNYRFVYTYIVFLLVSLVTEYSVKTYKLYLLTSGIFSRQENKGL